MAELLTLTSSKEPYPNRAEVICCEPIISAKEAGKLRSEGKDYIINDGDVIHFLFSV